MSTVDTRTSMTLIEAAAEIGCTTGRLRQMIKAGELEAEIIGGKVYLVPIKEVHRIKSIKHTRGRPRGTQKPTY